MSGHREDCCTYVTFSRSSSDDLESIVNTLACLPEKLAKRPNSGYEVQSYGGLNVKSAEIEHLYKVCISLDTLICVIDRFGGGMVRLASRFLYHVSIDFCSLQNSRVCQTRDEMTLPIGPETAFSRTSSCRGRSGAGSLICLGEQPIISFMLPSSPPSVSIRCWERGGGSKTWRFLEGSMSIG